MACNIQKNTLGQVVSVITKDGQPSELYDRLASVPFFTQEMALSALTKSYTVNPGLSDRYATGEPVVYFKTANGTTRSYREALNNSNGKPIGVGFLNGARVFSEVGSIPSVMGNTTPEGVINSLIVQGKVKESMQNGAFVGEGVSEIDMKASSNYLMAELNQVPNNRYIQEGALVKLPTEWKQTPTESSVPVEEVKSGYAVNPVEDQVEEEVAPVVEETVTNPTVEAIKDLSGTGFMVPEIGVQTNEDAAIDVENLRARLGYVPVVAMEDFEGIPMGFSISDELTTGDTVSPISGNVITNLQGGLGFNLTEAHKNFHWANILKSGAETQLHIAQSIYTENKDMFDSLWEQGKLPKGLIPVAVAKMSEKAIYSNEAVSRAAHDTYSTFKPYTLVKNQKALINSLIDSLESIPEIQNYLKVEGFKRMDDLITGVISSNFSLAQRGEFNRVFLNSNRPFRKKMAELGYQGGATIESVSSILKDPAFQNLETRDIISVVGIDVLNPEVKETQHPNYPWGLNGSIIGVLEKPVNAVDVFPTLRASVYKELLKNRPLVKALSEGIPTGSALTNLAFRGATASMNMSHEELLAGYLRQAFPGVNFNLNQASWDFATSKPNIQKFINKNGDIEGFTDGKSIYINPKFASERVLLHESGHIWGDYMRNHSKATLALWNRGLELTEGTPELTVAQKLYGDTDIAREEALMELISNKGASIMNKANKSKFGQWLSDVWNYIQNMFSSSEELLRDIRSKERTLDSITLDEFIGAALVDLTKGQSLDNNRGAYMSVTARKKVGVSEGKGVLFNVEKPTIQDNKAKGNKEFKLGNTSIQFSEGPGHLSLDLIETSSENRNSGSGTRALQAFNDYADSLGKTVTLYVSPRDSSTSEARLAQFYKNNGFVQRFEDNDYELVRYPNKVRFSVAESGQPGRGVPAVRQAAQEFKAENGIRTNTTPEISSLYPEVSKEISDLYETAQANSEDPAVKESYKALISEAVSQYNHIIKNGLKVERYEGEGEPYANSAAMLADLRDNNRLFFLPNDNAFGNDSSDTKGRIGLEKSGIKLEDGYEMTNSEIFRVVHDYFGHGILGNQFGPIGEENATLQHLELFSDLAKPALVFQTRGQNSWVNFSGVNNQSKAMLKEAAKLEQQGNLEEAQTIREQAQELFKFASPKDNVLPNKYNFRKYDTARRIKEQNEINNIKLGENSLSNIRQTLADVVKKSVTNSGVSETKVNKVVKLRGRDVSVEAEFTLDGSIDAKLRQAYPKFKGTQKIYKVTDGAMFRDMIKEVSEANKFGASVSIHSAEEFGAMDMYVTEDGSTGITLTKDGFLGGAFSDPAANRPNNLAQLMVLGIKQGAVTAEAFDTVLPDYYAEFGFKAVARIAFNDEYKPMVANGAAKDWNYEDYKDFNNGRPDVVFLIYDGGSRSTIEDRLKQFEAYKNYQKGETPLIEAGKDTYDVAERISHTESVKRFIYEQSKALPEDLFRKLTDELNKNRPDDLNMSCGI